MPDRYACSFESSIDCERARPPVQSSAIRHYCGLFGVFGDPDAVDMTYYALYAQQHRGQEAAGICSTDGTRILRDAGDGLVGEVFKPERLAKLRNPAAIGHVRYSTTGAPHKMNTQPFLIHQRQLGPVAIAHNGNLINADRLRERFEENGAIFTTTSDTEVIIHLLAQPNKAAREDRLVDMLEHLQGAYSLLLLFPEALVAVRDPFGIRPLCIGRLPGGAYAVASETCAFDIIGAEYIRDVEPGEIVTLDARGLHSRHFVSGDSVSPAHCIFEQIYFASPASDVFGENVHQVRVRMGAELAKEAPVEADAVVDIPNCARCAALGYSEASGLPYRRAFTTNHYVGRSFIMPNQHDRDLAVRMKLNVIKDTVRGQRLIVVEDSIVRGTTTRGKMGALRDAGVKEIHLRVASPPIRHGCYYGIDFPNAGDLIAHDKTVEEIRDYLGVDSLHYLSLDGMLRAVKHPPTHYCTACFSGNYPVPVTHQFDKYSLDRRQLVMFD